MICRTTKRWNEEMKTSNEFKNNINNTKRDQVNEKAQLV